MEAFDVQRLDLIASQIEAMKNIILNILILSKKSKRDGPTHKQHPSH